MPLLLSNVATQDAYVAATTLGPAATAEELVYTVANASAFMSLAPQNRSGTVEDWGPDILVPPSSNTVARVTGARFKSAIAGSPAQVVAQLILPGDPAPGSGTPFLTTLAASGAVGSGVQIPEVTLAQWPPASPTEQQAVVLILPATFDPIGGKPVRWLCHYDAANAIWHVMGEPLFAEVTTSEASAGAAYTDLATIGPSITLPRPGDYIVETAAYIGNTAVNTQGFISYQIGATAAADIDGATNTAQPVAGGYTFDFHRRRSKPGLGAVALVSKYKAGAAMNFSNRTLTVWPLRIT